MATFDGLMSRAAERAGPDGRRRDDATAGHHPACICSRSKRCRLMETRKITSVVVVDAHGLVEGVVHLHDLWRTQMV